MTARSASPNTEPPARTPWPGLVAAALVGALLYAATGPRESAPRQPSEAVAGLDAGERAAYLEAVSLASQPGPRELGRALELLEPLAQRDPPHAPALAHWADVQLRLAPNAPAGPIRTRLARALEHDPRNATAYRVLGDFALYRAGRWREASVAYDHALTLDPADAGARVARARLRAMRAEFDPAIADLRAALARHPGSVALVSDLGWFLFLAGRHREALESCERTQRLDAGTRHASRCFLDVHLERGDAAAALPHALALMRVRGVEHSRIEQLRAQEPHAALAEFHRWEIDWMARRARHQAGGAVWVALAHAHLGNWDTALDWLDRAAERGEREARFIAVIPTFRPLHPHPRFQRLLEHLNLPPPASIALPRMAAGF